MLRRSMGGVEMRVRVRGVTRVEDGKAVDVCSITLEQFEIAKIDYSLFKLMTNIQLNSFLEKTLTRSIEEACRRKFTIDYF